LELSKTIYEVATTLSVKTLITTTHRHLTHWHSAKRTAILSSAIFILTVMLNVVASF